jgi:hypothetical protein
MNMHKIVFTTKPDPKSLPGFWEPGYSPLWQPQEISFESVGPFSDEAFILKNVFTSAECLQLIHFMNQSPNFEEVGVQGMKDQKDERIGSLRTSIWCPDLAQLIWKRIFKHLPAYAFYAENGSPYRATDWWQNYVKDNDWDGSLTAQPRAISPLLRFMKYGNEGQHYAHYDAAFIYPDKKFRSLKSMVVYLTTNENAATRFVKDGQEEIPIWDRKHDDWSRPVKSEEIIATSPCVQGNVLFFDHRICHDVQQYFGKDPRVIIRGDVIYEMCYED